MRWGRVGLGVEGVAVQDALGGDKKLGPGGGTLAQGGDGSSEISLDVPRVGENLAEADADGGWRGVVDGHEEQINREEREGDEGRREEFFFLDLGAESPRNTGGPPVPQKKVLQPFREEGLIYPGAHGGGFAVACVLAEHLPGVWGMRGGGVDFFQVFVDAIETHRGGEFVVIAGEAQVRGEGR